MRSSCQLLSGRIGYLLDYNSGEHLVIISAALSILQIYRIVGIIGKVYRKSYVKIVEQSSCKSFSAGGVPVRNFVKVDRNIYVFADRQAELSVHLDIFDLYAKVQAVAKQVKFAVYSQIHSQVESYKFCQHTVDE